MPGSWALRSGGTPGCNVNVPRSKDSRAWRRSSSWRRSAALVVACLALLAAGRGLASEAHVGLAEGRAAIDPGRRPALRWEQAEGPVTVFVAKKIVTMSPSQPEALSAFSKLCRYAL